MFRIHIQIITSKTTNIFTDTMFLKKNAKTEDGQEMSKDDIFLDGIKKDMTNRAAITAKQESTINNLIEELQAERKEMRAMRKLYEKRMNMDNEIIDKFIRALERRKQ